MKFNKNRVSNHSKLYYISEVDRKNLVGKVKAQSPSRYNNRLSYRAKSSGSVNIEDLIDNDLLVVDVPVGDYICTIAYKGILKELVDIVKKQPKHNITLQSVIRAIMRSIDNTDILVDCTCADFKYRFAYWATKYGYKYGKPENRPTDITNPKDSKGSMCKHLTSILSNKRWLVKLATVVNNIVKEYIDDIRNKFNLDPDELVINKPGRPSNKIDRNTSMTDKEDSDTVDKEKE